MAMENMAKLLAKKRKGDPMPEHERTAKMNVLQDLSNQASHAMSSKLKSKNMPATGHGKLFANPGSIEEQHGENVLADKGKFNPSEKNDTSGPGDHQDPNMTRTGSDHHGEGPGDEHPEHGSIAGENDGHGPGHDHPEHGSVAGESDAHGPGHEHTTRGTVAGHDDGEGPGDHHNPEHGTEGIDYSHLGVDELNQHLQALMAHKKRLEG